MREKLEGKRNYQTLEKESEFSSSNFDNFNINAC